MVDHTNSYARWEIQKYHQNVLICCRPEHFRFTPASKEVGKAGIFRILDVFSWFSFLLLGTKGHLAKYRAGRINELRHETPKYFFLRRGGN